MFARYIRGMAVHYLFSSNRFVAALFQESPVIVDIDGNDIKKTVVPTEPEDKDESIKPYVSFFFLKRLYHLNFYYSGQHFS